MPSRLTSRCGDLPTGYALRAPMMADVESVYRLAAACSLADHGEVDHTLEVIRTYWERDVADLTSDGWAIFSEEGELVAEADVARRGDDQFWCYANVHPGHVGCGLGTYLLARAEGRMREWVGRTSRGASIMARQEIGATDRRARELLERHGYAPIRRRWRMQIELDGPPAVPAWPEGIALRSFVPSQDEYRVYEAMEEAFAEHWGHVPRSFEQYAIHAFEGERYQPALFFLAMDGDTIAGCALCRRTQGRAVVGSLGVRRAYRQRGIGLALLLHAFAEFYRLGERRIDLSVDAENPTSAVALYEKAGMRAVREWVEYAKELAAGDERVEGGHD